MAALNYSAILAPCGNRTRIPAVGSTLYYFGHFLPVVLALGIVGNVLNLLALGVRNRTNVFLSCMAFADLCFLLLMNWLNLTTFDGPALNDAFLSVFFRSKMTVTVLVNWFAGCSTWFAVMVTLERLVAVRNPLKAGHLFNKWTMSSSIIIIAVVVFLSHLHHFFVMHPVPRPLCGDPKQTHYFFVAYRRRHNPLRYDYVQTSTAFSGVVSVVVPILLLVIFNSLLIHSLYRSRQSLATLGQSSRAAQECRVTVTVVVITVTAVVLLTPSFGMALWDAIAFGPSRKVPRWYKDFAYFCNFLVIVDRTSNFLLYCLSSKAFRRKLCAVLTGRFKKRSKRNQSSASTCVTQDSVRYRPSVYMQKSGMVDGKGSMEMTELLSKPVKSEV